MRFFQDSFFENVIIFIPLQYANDGFVWIVLIFVLLKLCSYYKRKWVIGQSGGAAEAVSTWGFFVPTPLNLLGDGG